MIGRIIQGNFEILEKIGQGGMAAVYKARQISLDRIVAVKILSAMLVDIGDLQERFRQEARIIARLTHPNIVQVHDIYEVEGEEGTLCIVMEYLEGMALQDVLAAQRPLKLGRALSIAEQVATGLAYAHAQEVVHRDIKPQNVMVLADDRVKIMDFGIARLRSSSIRTQTGSTMGTPEYMSPEQAEGKPVDFRSDLYSLAVVLYVMVTGELPFTADSPVAIGLKHLQQPPPLPREINPAIPAAVEAVVLKGMAKKPEDRFLSAEEFRRELLRFGPATDVDVFAGAAQTMLGPAITSSPDDAAPTEPAQARMGGLAALFARAGDAAASLQRLGPKKLAAVAGGVAILLIVVIVSLFSGRGAVSVEDLKTMPVPKLLERLEALRQKDAGQARILVVENESTLYERVRAAYTDAVAKGRDAEAEAIDSAAGRAVLPSLSGDARRRWSALATPYPVPTPTGTATSGSIPVHVAAVQPNPTPHPEPTPREDIGTPPLTASEIEQAMRRLNQGVAADSGRARKAIDAARARARQMASVPIGRWERDLFSDCLDGFIDGVIYDQENWRHQAEFAQFLAGCEDWHLSEPVRDGLLRDARELLRRAVDKCPDAAERKKLLSLDQQVQASLVGSRR